MNASAPIPRRQFLKLVGATTVAGTAGKALAAGPRKISIVVQEADPVASTKPVAWAVKQLNQALTEQGTTAQVVASDKETAGSSLVIVISSTEPGKSSSFPRQQNSNRASESFRIVPGRMAGADALWVSASDTRGLVYGVLELADRVETSSRLMVGTSPLRADRRFAREPRPQRGASLLQRDRRQALVLRQAILAGYLDMLACTVQPVQPR